MSARDLDAGSDADGAPGGRFLPAAGFWRRSLSSLLDLAWAFPLGWAAHFGLSRLELPASLPGWGLALLVAAAVPILLAVSWHRFGTTPGKAMLGLRVVALDGRRIDARQAALRGAGYLLGALTLGLGFVMVGLNASRRGLHDQLAGTYVADAWKGRRQRRAVGG